MEELIVVDNLKCNGCASTIKTKIEDIVGVEKVDVDVETSQVKVKHTSEVKMEQIIQKLEKLGYPKEGTSNTYQKAVSYISCATGKFSS